jgi:WhiB family redox-sensing transcriptional regulator
VKASHAPPWSLQQAACKGSNPVLFDATFGDPVFDALSYCYRCPVIPECLDYVLPHRSYFDGVAAGKVWRGGTEVEPVLFEYEGE